MDSLSSTHSCRRGTNLAFRKTHIKEVAVKEGSRAYQNGITSIIGCSENGKNVMDVIKFQDGSTFGSTPQNITKFFKNLFIGHNTSVTKYNI